MATLKQDINDAAKALKGLTQKVERIKKQLAMLDKPKAAKAKPKKKAPAKKAPAKKAVARKAVAKKSAPKKAPAKKAAAKKPATAVATITGIINRSQKGIDVSTLMAKTKYNKKKVANLIFKLKKQGKIKSLKKGVYTKA